MYDLVVYVVVYVRCRGFWAEKGPAACTAPTRSLTLHSLHAACALCYDVRWFPTLLWALTIWHDTIWYCIPRFPSAHYMIMLYEWGREAIYKCTSRCQQVRNFILHVHWVEEEPLVRIVFSHSILLFSGFYSVWYMNLREPHSVVLNSLYYMVLCMMCALPFGIIWVTSIKNAFLCGFVVCSSLCDGFATSPAFQSEKCDSIECEYIAMREQEAQFCIVC